MKRLTPALLTILAIACQAPAFEPAPSDSIREAEELIESGEPRDALLVLDQALEADPESAEAWFARGTANLAVAAADPSSGLFFYSDALHDFERSLDTGGGVEALFAASRAARLNLDADKALQYASRGMQALEAAWPKPELSPRPEQTLVEAAFDVYVNRRNADEDSTEPRAEIEGTLKELLLDEPRNSWARVQLANLYQWETQYDEALGLLREGLELDPHQPTLHERLVAVALSDGGRERVIAVYEDFRAEHPDQALGYWFPALEIFQRALETIRTKEDASADFRSSEQMLIRCRELNSDYESDCKGWEVMCRNGLGWSAYNAGELEVATEAFLSMEEVFEGGMDWEIKNDLPSGVRGLEFIAGGYAEKGDNIEAAAVYEHLRAYRPEDPDFANNAAFFHRDAGALLEDEARNRLRLAEQEEDPELAGELRQQGEELRLRARETMEKSYAAYVVATELAPDDVRVWNDTGLIMTYHLRTDADAAEKYLVRAIELGREQLADEGLDEEDRDSLMEAYGDAHQNLGLVHLTMRDDPATARSWFEKAIEIGPRPRITREWVVKVALPACDKAEKGELDLQKDLDERIW